jgi:DNA-binding MarR family transcriptional regulator
MSTRTRIAASAPRRRRASQDDAATQVLRQFRQVFNAVKTHFQQVERTVGLGGAQVWALSVVRDNPAVGIGALARTMDIHQSTASNLVKALVDRGLVAVAKDDTDRRAVQLRLLPAGQKLLKQVPSPFASGLLPAALRSLDAATLERLHEDLAILIDALGADERGAKIPLAEL